jgi:hypothetical protein
MEKQRDKAAKRMERKAVRAQEGPPGGPEIEELESDLELGLESDLEPDLEPEPTSESSPDAGGTDQTASHD